MSKLLRHSAAGLTLVASLAVAGNAGAASEGARIIVNPVEWTLPAGQCGDLPSGVSVTGTGTSRSHLLVFTDENGRRHASRSEAATGTAVDSEGNTYTWSYHNTIAGSWVPVNGVRTDGRLLITDHFVLTGSGGENRIHTFFVAEITYSESGEVTTVIKNSIADSETCDPL